MKWFVQKKIFCLKKNNGCLKQNYFWQQGHAADAADAAAAAAAAENV